MRHVSLSLAVLLAAVSAHLTGCASLPSNGKTVARRSSKADVQFDVARLQEREGKLAKAQEIYTALYKKNPKDFGVCHRLGVVCARQGDMESANKYFAEARAISPEDTQLLNDYGYACYLNDQMDVAESCLRDAIRKDPQDRRAKSNLALVLGNQGKFDESYRLFRQVGTDAEAHANLAYLYSQNGDGAKAMQHYSRALSLDSHLESAANAMIEIAAMENYVDRQRAQEEVLAQQEAKPARAEVKQASVENAPSAKTAEAIAAEVQKAPAKVVAAPADENPFEIVEPESQPVVAKVQPQPAAQPVETSFDDFMADDDQAPAVAPVAVAPAPVPVTPAPAAAPQPSGRVLHLIDQLHSSDPAVVKPAIHQLGELGSDATAAVPEIREMLSDDDAYIRIHAALALYRITNNSRDTLPVILAGLSHQEAGVRSFAATALGMGPHVEQAIAPLQKATNDSNSYVQLHAAECLSHYAGHESMAVNCIVSHLTDKESNVRWLATFLLAEIAPQSEQAVQALTVALQDPDRRVRAGAAFALGGIGSSAKSALNPLRKATQDQAEDVREAAQTAISEIENAAPRPLGMRDTQSNRTMRMSHFVQRTHSERVAQAR